MKANLGITDMIIRLVIAATIIVLYFLSIGVVMYALVFLIMACLFVLTSVISSCPIYFVFLFQTDKKQ